MANELTTSQQADVTYIHAKPCWWCHDHSRWCMVSGSICSPQKLMGSTGASPACQVGLWNTCYPQFESVQWCYLNANWWDCAGWIPAGCCSNNWGCSWITFHQWQFSNFWNATFHYWFKGLRETWLALDFCWRNPITWPCKPLFRFLNGFYVCACAGEESR